MPETINLLQMDHMNELSGCLLRIDEVARFLAISRSQCYRLARTGELPSLRFGKVVRVLPAALEEFITIHRNPLDKTIGPRE